jgi:hypothetical protein
MSQMGKMRKSHSEHFSTAVPQKADVVLQRGERQLRANSRHFAMQKNREPFCKTPTVETPPVARSAVI